MNYLRADQQEALLAAIRRGDSTRISAVAAQVSANTVSRWRGYYARGLCGGCNGELHEGSCARVVAIPEVRAEIMRLRREDDLTTREIAARVGVTEGVAYGVLTGVRLRVRRGRRRYGNAWTDAENTALSAAWPREPWHEILRLLPGRTRGAIERQASFLGVRRPPNLRRRISRPSPHPVIAALASARYELDLTATEVQSRTGIAHQSIVSYELNISDPTFGRVARWARSLGFELILTPLGESALDQDKRREILSEFRDTLRRENRVGIRPAARAVPEAPVPAVTGRSPEVVRVPIPIAPARRAPERPLRETEIAAATTVATLPVSAPSAAAPRTARPLREPHQRPRWPTYVPKADRIPPDRAAELSAIDRYLAEKGGADAVRVPGVGDPAIDDLPPLVWDNRRRVHTRDPSVIPPGSGDWRVRNRHGGRSKNDSVR